MVRVLNIETSYGHSQIVNLFADTKSEVAAPDEMEIVGMNPDIKITQGASIMTASGEMAFLKSDNTWTWV